MNRLRTMIQSIWPFKRVGVMMPYSTGGVALTRRERVMNLARMNPPRGTIREHWSDANPKGDLRRVFVLPRETQVWNAQIDGTPFCEERHRRKQARS